MDNETVSYDERIDQWLPSSTYPWPARSTVDYQSYYPTRMKGVTISPDVITYTDIDVAEYQKDVMYSDKSVGYTDNIDVPGGIVPSTNTGVPIFFRHALAKVKVQVELTYNHKEEYDGTVTDWVVEIGRVELTGLKKKGNCRLTLSDASATGLVTWTKPVNEKGYSVWTDDGSLTSVSGDMTGKELIPECPTTAIDEFFVLPQMLSKDVQQITLDISIKTIRNGKPFLSEDLKVHADLYDGGLPAWQMNQSVTYKLKISPTRSNGSGGNPDDPVDPMNPDLTDAIIHFDPAVDSWESVGFEATLNL